MLVLEMTMIRSNIEEIKSRFSTLLLSVRSALEEEHIKVEDVRQMLIGIFQRDDCIPSTNFVEIFNALTTNYLWSYQHHSPVEKLVRRFLPDQTSLITEYKSYLSGFYTTTKLIDYIRVADFPEDDDSEETDDPNRLPLQSYSVKHYRKLKVVLKTDRKISELSLVYGQELWNSFAEEFEIPSLTTVIHRILDGSIEIIWLVLPHVAEMIIASAHRSTSFFRQHKIIHIAVDDKQVYDADQTVSPILYYLFTTKLIFSLQAKYEKQLFLLCARGCEDVSQILKLLSKGVDLNASQNEVCD